MSRNQFNGMSGWRDRAAVMSAPASSGRNRWRTERSDATHNDVPVSTTWAGYFLCPYWWWNAHGDGTAGRLAQPSQSTLQAGDSAQTIITEYRL